MSEVYRVEMPRRVEERSHVYVEAESLDDAEITAIEAEAWTDLSWTKVSDSPRDHDVRIIGIAPEQIYRRKG